MNCNNLLKYGWKGEKTFNRKDKPKLLFSIQPWVLPFTVYRRDAKKVKKLVVTKEMLVNMDDVFFRDKSILLNKTWITKSGLEICNGDIIANVSIEGEYGYEGLGWLDISYECNKCKASLRTHAGIEDDYRKILLEVPTTNEQLNEFLTNYIRSL